MKITKILAGISALAIASMSSVVAFADGPNVTSSFDGDFVDMQYDETYKVWSAKISLGNSEYDPATVTGIKLTFTTNEADKGVTGGVALNSKKSSWDQKDEWGTPGTEKALTAEGEGNEYTLTYDFGALGEEYWGSPSDADGYWAEVFVQFYWADEGVEVNVSNVEIVGEKKSTDTPDSQAESKEESKDESKEESKSEESSSKAEESSKAASNNNNGKSGNTTTTGTTSAASSAAASDNTNQATGATAGLAFAGLALAGAVAVVAKKKN